MANTRIERVLRHDGIVAVLDWYTDQARVYEPHWAGDERWHPIVHEAVKLQQLSGEASVRVLVGSHAVLISGGAGHVVGVVFIKGHPVVKSVVRMVRQLLRPQAGSNALTKLPRRDAKGDAPLPPPGVLPPLPMNLPRVDGPPRSRGDGPGPLAPGPIPVRPPMPPLGTRPGAGVAPGTPPPGMGMGVPGHPSGAGPGSQGNRPPGFHQPDLRAANQAPSDPRRGPRLVPSVPPPEENGPREKN